MEVVQLETGSKRANRHTIEVTGTGSSSALSWLK